MSITKNLGKWQNYAHYVLLTGGLFVTHWLSGITGLEANVVSGGTIDWIILFMFYTVGLFVFDTLIHLLFASLPEPLKWAD